MRYPLPPFVILRDDAGPSLRACQRQGLWLPARDCHLRNRSILLPVHPVRRGTKRCSNWRFAPAGISFARRRLQLAGNPFGHVSKSFAYTDRCRRPDRRGAGRIRGVPYDVVAAGGPRPVARQGQREGPLSVAIAPETEPLSAGRAAFLAADVEDAGRPAGRRAPRSRSMAACRSMVMACRRARAVTRGSRRGRYRIEGREVHHERLVGTALRDYRAGRQRQCRASTSCCEAVADGLALPSRPASCAADRGRAACRLRRAGVLRRGEGRRSRRCRCRSLPPLPPDPTNAYADQPAAAAFGATLFFDQRLSRDGEVACATCHMIDRQFQDDLPRAVGIGDHQPPHHAACRRRLAALVLLGRAARQPVGAGADAAGRCRASMPATAPPTRISWPTISASATSAFSGRCPTCRRCRDNAGPLGSDGREGRLGRDDARTSATAVESRLRQYRQGDRRLRALDRRCRRRASTALPRRLPPASSRPKAMRPHRRGDRRPETVHRQGASARRCHNGPRFTDDAFPQHRRAGRRRPAARSRPRDGVVKVAADPFNCLGTYQRRQRRDACGELRFMVKDRPGARRAFKTPSLRGVAGRPPYMHAGQIATLEAVIDHYARAPASRGRPVRAASR